MEPNWVRPVYLYLMSLIGVVVMALGSLGVAMGVVHLAAPKTKQTDQLSRLVGGVVDIADNLSSDSLGRDEKKALHSVRSELNKQSRWSGTNELLKGLVIAGIGFGIYSFHQKRTAAGQAALAAKAASLAPAVPAAPAASQTPGAANPPGTS